MRGSTNRGSPQARWIYRAICAEMEPGISDHDVLNLTNQEEAILLTADKDFGELVFLGT